jgi:cobalt-zinc-cadmium efflux system protein
MGMEQTHIHPHDQQEPGHGHEHHVHGPGMHVHGRTEGPMLWLCLLITLAFVVAEAVAGHVSNSLALLSDAGHNFSDAFALGLAAYAIWISKRPANAAMTYGYHRVSILTALVNSTTLLVIAALILTEAIALLRHPEPVHGPMMMWVAGVSLVMNTVIAALLRGGAKDSMNLRAAYLHMAGDALSAAGVLAAGWVVTANGWVYGDLLVSVLIAIFIGWSSIGVLTDAVNVLLEGTPKGLDLDRMIAAMQRVDRVLTVHDVHVWTVSDKLNFLSAHVAVDGARTMEECGAIVRAVRELLAHDFGIAHATIQVESTGTCCDKTESDPLHCHDITASDPSHTHVH